MNKNIDKEEFLKLSLKELSDYTPKAMIYSPSGTRRDAILHHYKDHGKDFYEFSLKRMLEAFAMLFQHGVQHLFNTVVIPSLFQEITPGYQENLWRWLNEGLTGKSTLDFYQKNQWRVRIIFGDKIPQLQAAQQRLVSACPATSKKNLWLYMVEDFGLMYQRIFEVIRAHPTHSLTEICQDIYGTNIPEAELYIATGKPTLSPDLLPPYIMRDRMECYWSEKPGYSLDSQQFRKILYDKNFVRKTWRKDKTGRAEEALKQKKLWEEAPIIGLGQRIGPFWYPQPFALPEDSPST